MTKGINGTFSLIISSNESATQKSDDCISFKKRLEKTLFYDIKSYEKQKTIFRDYCAIFQFDLFR